MRHKQVRQTQFGLQLIKQVDDTRLNRNVQCRDRFIQDQQLRFEGEGACNANTLALPPGEVTRIAVKVRPLQADQLDELGRPLLNLLLGVPVVFQRFREDF